MQMQTSVQFTSLRCIRGYDLVPLRGEAKPSYGNARLLVELERSDAPPEWVTTLVPKGPERQQSDPLKCEGLFKYFGEMPYDPSAYQSFANQWGLLSGTQVIKEPIPPQIGRARGAARSKSAGTRVDETLAAVLSAAMAPAPGPKWPDRSPRPPVETQATVAIAAFHTILRSALGLATDAEPRWVREYRAASMPHERVPLPGNGTALHDPRLSHLVRLIEKGVKVAIESDPETDLPILVIRPVDLMTAISLQALNHLSGVEERSGVKLLQCKQCHAYFKVGPGTGRRSTSEFCSRKCQDQHSYQTRKRKRPGQP
jgi:hypothetical protein